MPHRLLTSALAFISLFCAPTSHSVAQRIAPARANGEAVEWHLAELARHQVPATVDGVVGLLQDCSVGGKRYASAAREFELLGAAEFEERIAAQTRLFRTPLISSRLVEDACRSANLEVVWRADELRRRAARHSDYLLVAALQLLSTAGARDELSQDGLRKANAALEKFADELVDPLLRWRLLEVLNQLSTSPESAASNATAVERRANAGDPAARLVLAGAQLRRDRAAAVRQLAVLRDHADPRVRVAAELLEKYAVAANAPVIANAALNATSIDKHESEKVLSLWQSVAPQTGRRPLAGRTLVATGSYGLVLEFNGDGRTEWRQPIRAWSAEPLTSGGTLLAAFEEQRIVELNRAGEVVWEFSGIAATRAKPLPDGRILATDFSAARIVEIDREKNVVWSLATPEGAFDVERTAKGHTFYGCANLIREVTPDGRVVGQWPVSGRLNGLQVLADGRMLIANFGGNEVALLNRDGTVAWRLAESQPSDAFQSADGRLLVTTAKRCAEFDDKREFVREWTPARYGTARR